MKLLFDHNLSHRLVPWLQDEFPGSTHVRVIGLHQKADAEIWRYAIKEHYAIVSKDADFHELSLLYGHPPKVIWLQIGNCRAQETEGLIRISIPIIRSFDADVSASFLILN